MSENLLIKLIMNLLIFSIWLSIIATSYFFLLFGYVRFSNKQDNLNTLIGFFAVSFVFFNIPPLLLIMFQDDYLHIITLSIWIIALGLPLLAMSLLILISTGLVYVYSEPHKPKSITKLSIAISKHFAGINKTRNDTYRKINHVLIFIGLIVIWIVNLINIRNYTGTWEGMVVKDNNMLFLYLQIILNPSSVREVLFSLGWFYYLLFFFFYGFCLFILVNEITRKYEKLAFPFIFFGKAMLSEEEKKSYGSYLYFAIGHMFAAFVSPPMIFLAILGMSSIGDLTASQVGIRYGRKHIKWNKNKTWEGTIASTVVCFVICIFLVGGVWSVIYTLIFFVFDILLGGSIRVSDNLITPIVCALLYVLVRFFFNLDYYTIILLWI